MNFKERLIEFLKYLGIGQTKFEENTGLGRASISKIKDGMSALNLAKITEAYPELNIEWLITGKGPMLKNTPESVVSEPQAVYGSDIANLKRKIEMLESEVKDLKEQREVLKELIEVLKGSISDKDFIIDLLNEKVSAPVSVKAKSTLK